MKNEIMTAAIMELLPREDLPRHEVGNMVPYLTDKYGVPEIQANDSDSDKEELTFSLPNHQLTLVRSVQKQVLLDISLTESVVAVPCRNMGLTPLVRVAIGMGEADFLLSPGTATATATTLASIDLARSFGIQQAGLCVQCTAAGANCSCQVIPSRPPTTRISVSIRRFMGIPVGGTVQVLILQPLRALCLSVVSPF